MKINDIWHSSDETIWLGQLDRYNQFLKPVDRELVKELEPLDLTLLRRFDERAWYDFLHDKYFRWKYTAANRLATTRAQLKKYLVNNELGKLDLIRQQLLSLDPNDIGNGLRIASGIRGLGIAGASGLLTLMYPTHFGTVDQFVVKSLRGVSGLVEETRLGQMNPEGLSPADGVILVSIMRAKANANNVAFGTTFWIPKRIDEILWTYGRD